MLRLLVLLLVTAWLLPAQVHLPQNKQGRTVSAYIEAFNGGKDSSMRQFFLEHISSADLRQTPLDKRLERMKAFRAEIKSLSVLKLIESTETGISIAARTGTGETVTLTFEFNPGPEHMFSGLRIESGESPPTSGPPMDRTEFLTTVEQYLRQRAGDDMFSGAVLVQRDTNVLFERAFGDADKQFSIPNRVDTKFNIGSICKFFTRIAIGQLLQAGKLSLDDHLSSLLPEYPNAAVARRITVDQLLTMRSGMGDIFGDSFDRAPKDRIRSLQDYLPFFVRDSLLFEPGTQRRYSNAGFIVLGLIIEKLSGQDYYAYEREHIFRPAGMTNTDWYPLSSVTPNLATGYTRPGDTARAWNSNIHLLPERGSSAGGGYTTLDDLARLMRALTEGALLSPRYSEWVLGGDLPSSDPGMPLRHGAIGMAGGTAGVNAAVEFDAGRGDLVVVLSNYDPPSAETVARQVSGWLKRLK